MADDKGKDKVTRDLTFDTPDSKGPGGIDIAAIIARRREKAVLEDEERARALIRHPERFVRPRITRRPR